MKLSDVSIHAWLNEYGIKNEKGDLIDFKDHFFLFDIYREDAQKLVVMKPAQVGLSTLEVIKNIYDARSNKMDIIYTLPTDHDVNVFVGGKVNRIIAANPILQKYTEDKDSIEQKQIGESMIYFRGTWSAKAAIMVTADRLVHDEVDSSKQDVIADYQARLQHSKFKQTHVFSHPSTPNAGVDIQWKKSDQKEFFITCPHCNKEQYLSWNTEDEKLMNVDIANKKFVCKGCRGELGKRDRAFGRWVARKKDAEWSGYHISLLMAPWVSAEEIVDKYNECLEGKQTMDYFYNKVLGLPYAGSGNSVTEDMIMSLITDEQNLFKGRLVMGLDTGKDLRYVVGNAQGIVGYGQLKDYSPDPELGITLEQSVEYFLKKFPELVLIIDQGGDIIGSRKLRAKYPGRVFLCHYSVDRKTMQLIRWGGKDEDGNVVVDRNRMLQLVIDEIKEKRWKLYNGSYDDYHDYWLHWSHIYRTVEEDEKGMRKYVWKRSDRDDWVHATVYWRVGLSKFLENGFVAGNDQEIRDNSYFVSPDDHVEFNPLDFFTSDKEDDWRHT